MFHEPLLQDCQLPQIKICRGGSESEGSSSASQVWRVCASCRVSKRHCVRVPTLTEQLARTSANGGMIPHEKHLIEAWSKPHCVVAMSTPEVEL